MINLHSFGVSSQDNCLCYKYITICLKYISNYPPGSKSEALQLGVPAIPEGRRPEGMVECPRGAKTREPKLIRYILQTYSYIFAAQAVILMGKRSLKRQMIKEVTREKEKKRQENQKNEVIKRKGKDKKKKKKIQRKISNLLLTKVSQGSRCAALFFFHIHYTYSHI